ncbi:MAG: 3-oxoacid CoA-transferase subunit A, partial [Clostridia bacterium]|nr:3-oxoacid CoA-transferase subunit A [Clostridia bacterium]
MIDKVTAAYEAVKNVHDGDTLMVGGFLMAGSPETLLKTLLEESNAGNLTVISNDTGTVDSHMIQIMKQGRVVKVNASYIGSNPATGQMLINDPKSVTLYPQGTLAEKIRIGGAGIAGFYTPVGVGTIVEEGKERRYFDGKAYLLELPFHANVAFVKATIADRMGNCFMGKST